MFNIVLTELAFNLSNFTGIGPFNYAFNPYLGIIGDMFFTFLILITAVGVYIQSDQNAFLTSIILMVGATIYVGLMPSMMGIFIIVIAALIITVLIYQKFVEGRKQ